MSLLSTLKKVGGVVTGIAAAVTKVVAPAVSGVLANVSQKLLASPTPVQESAAALITGAPPAPSTPIKASSVALQSGIAPTVSTVIKQSAIDLTGQVLSPGKIQVPSPLSSLVKESEPPKTPKEISEGTPSGEKKDSTMTIVLVVVAFLLFGFILIPMMARRRR